MYPKFVSVSALPHLFSLNETASDLIVAVAVDDAGQIHWVTTYGVALDATEWSLNEDI